VFGYLASRAEVTTGNEGFAPDNPEIAASERIRELFGDSASEGVIQVVIRHHGGDVISADGLRAASVLVLPSLLALWEGYHRRRGHTVVEQPAGAPAR
jgi:hypothetical protein